jgi:hypothetical protein
MEFDRKAEAFDKEHSGEDGFVVIDGYLLFADGATRSLKSWQDLGFEYSDPPADKTGLATRQKRFWELRLSSLVAEFEHTRTRCENAAQMDAHRFGELKKQLKQLQTKVRSARSKLAHIEVKVRGYEARDVSLAWNAWKALQKALEEEAHMQLMFDDALLKNASAGELERRKKALEEAKLTTKVEMVGWNTFEPKEARSVVCRELDAQARQKRESELAEIEI